MNSNKSKITVKEVAIELMKGIQPKLNDMQEQIDKIEEKVNAFEGRMQTLSSVLMNMRKHKKKGVKNEHHSY